MELKGILEGFVGAMIAVLLGPVVVAGIQVFIAWMDIRREDRMDELTIRKDMAVMGSMRRKNGRPGKTWIIHPSHQDEFHRPEGGSDGLRV